MYDTEGRITQATGAGSAAYKYDGSGRRVVKSGSGVSTVYVYDAAGQLAAEYSSAAAGTVLCTTCYLSTDYLGSTRLVTDASGNVISRHAFLPFGQEIAGNQYGRDNSWGAFNDGVNQRFTGKESDQESGFDYFGARYYGPALGRFTSPDEFTGGPVDVNSPGEVESPGPLPYADIRNPQSLNKYAYALNNPLKYVDPDGHDPVMDEVEEELPAVAEACGAGAGACAEGSAM
ncbi:MAG: hypothetical protein JO061_24070 [Acidobacteriaceae bacterium]|nr:hypothetical protein [Acidobacteriaceae bacterium]